MKITDENFDVGRLLGAIDQLREVLSDAGFNEDNLNLDIWLPEATNEQMTDIATLIRRTEKFLNIETASDGKVYLRHNLDGYTIHSIEKVG